MDPHSRAPKKNKSHENEVLLQNTMHLLQTPCYQRGSLCQDPVGNRTTWRPPDHRKRCKLQWYGYVFRSSGLAKTILQGTVKGERRQGRQKKRWEDSIREWTGMEFTKSQWAVENRKKKKIEETGCGIICGATTTLAEGIDDDLRMMCLFDIGSQDRSTEPIA